MKQRDQVLANRRLAPILFRRIAAMTSKRATGMAIARCSMGVLVAMRNRRPRALQPGDRLTSVAHRA